MPRPAIGIINRVPLTIFLEMCCRLRSWASNVIHLKDVRCPSVEWVAVAGRPEAALFKQLRGLHEDKIELV